MASRQHFPFDSRTYRRSHGRLPKILIRPQLLSSSFGSMPLIFAGLRMPLCERRYAEGGTARSSNRLTLRAEGNDLLRADHAVPCACCPSEPYFPFHSKPALRSMLYKSPLRCSLLVFQGKKLARPFHQFLLKSKMARPPFHHLFLADKVARPFNQHSCDKDRTGNNGSDGDDSPVSKY